MLSGGNATYGGGAVPGTFAWALPSALPSVGTSSQLVTFTPADTNNYQVVTFSVNVAVSIHPVQAWAGSFGLSGASAGANADPDGDGLNNAQEYAFGLNPSATGGEPAVLSQETNQVRLVFLRKDTGGISYAVKSASSLTGGFTNTVTASAKDNEENPATASASATIKSYWFGRTPGYWKNHPQDWISGYLPTQFVQGVFTIPSSLLSAGILDLDGNRSKDTLMTALGYQGGSKLSGAAQILLRAAVAALLNEAYYGADYPAASTPAELIANVNVALATLDRVQYLALATTLDKWNNGVEGPLP